MLLNSAFISLFLSTPSARRATSQSSAMRYNSRISIHALREEGDALHSLRLLALPKFLSTPSARRATSSRAVWTKPKLFLSTPSARRATSQCSTSWSAMPISIHALREEGDVPASSSLIA